MLNQDVVSFINQDPSDDAADVRRLAYLRMLLFLFQAM